MNHIPETEADPTEPFSNTPANAEPPDEAKDAPRPKAVRPSAKLSALDLMYTYYDRSGRD